MTKPEAATPILSPPTPTPDGILASPAIDQVRTNTIGQSKIRDIECLRGIAISAVLFYHFSLSATMFSMMHQSPSSMPFFLGVELFFIISGFVVTKSFAQKGYSIRIFFMKRVFRILPLIAFFILLTALLNLIHTPFHAAWGAFLRNALAILFFYLTFKDDGLYANGAMWTLSVEEQFYVVFPLFILALSKMGILGPRLGIAIFSTVAAVLALVVRPLASIYEYENRMPFILFYLAHLKFDFLCLGVVVYFLRIFPRFKIIGLTPSLLKSILILCLIAPFIIVFTCGGGDLLSPHEAWRTYTYGLAICGLCFSIVVGISSLNLNLLTFHPWIDRTLDYMGSRSYSLYVLHFPIFILAWLVINSCCSWLFYVDPIWYGLVQIALSAIMGIPIVEFSYRYIEKPMIRFGSRLLVEPRG